MNTVTATFSNLDYANFDQYIQDADFLRLQMVSFSVEDELYVTMVLKGDYEMIKTFDSWIHNEENWIKETV